VAVSFSSFLLLSVYTSSIFLDILFVSFISFSLLKSGALNGNFDGNLSDRNKRSGLSLGPLLIGSRRFQVDSDFDLAFALFFKSDRLSIVLFFSSTFKKTSILREFFFFFKIFGADEKHVFLPITFFIDFQSSK